MTTPAVQQKPLYIDVNFSPPPDVDAVFLNNGVPIGVIDIDDDTDSDDQGVDQVDDGTEESDDDALLAPENLTILAQNVHQGKGATQVVDAIIGFDDVDGATDYILRISKI